MTRRWLKGLSWQLRSVSRPLKRPLNWALLILFLVSVGAILLGQENPYFRVMVCSPVPCPSFLHSPALEKLAYDLGVASLVSLLFYWLVVRIPENAKRRRIRKSFARHWREFKEDSIASMLIVADGTFTWGFHQELVEQERFRDYFKEPAAEPGQDRWDALHNKMNAYYLDEILTHLEILRSEIQLVLLVLDIDDVKVLEFLKRLSATIVRMRSTTLDHDSMKSFWEVFSGWSFVDGYPKRDFFEDMIAVI